MIKKKHLLNFILSNPDNFSSDENTEYIIELQNFAWSKSKLIYKFIMGALLPEEFNQKT